MALCVTACAATGPGDSYCRIAQPLWLEPADVDAISDGLARDILAHNERWRAVCG